MFTVPSGREITPGGNWSKGPFGAKNGSCAAQFLVACCNHDGSLGAMPHCHVTAGFGFVIFAHAERGCLPAAASGGWSRYQVAAAAGSKPYQMHTVSTRYRRAQKSRAPISKYCTEYPSIYPLVTRDYVHGKAGVASNSAGRRTENPQANDGNPLTCITGTSYIVRFACVNEKKHRVASKPPRPCVCKVWLQSPRRGVLRRRLVCREYRATNAQCDVRHFCSHDRSHACLWGRQTEEERRGGGGGYLCHKYQVCVAIVGYPPRQVSFSRSARERDGCRKSTPVGSNNVRELNCAGRPSAVDLGHTGISAPHHLFLGELCFSPHPQ